MLALSHQDVSAGASPDAGTVVQALMRINWTCALPVEENQPLDQTAAGRSLIALVFNQTSQMNNSTEFVASVCGDGCNDYSGLDHLRCITRYRTCTTVVTQFLAEQKIQSCFGRILNATELRDSLCSHVQPGHFCAVVEGNTETCALMKGARALALPCIAGFRCAGGADQPRACGKGYYCPEETGATPGECPEGTFCPVAATSIPCRGQATGTGNITNLLQGVLCMPGYEDSGNRTLLPVPCPSGDFCVNGTLTQCPEGTYCPSGVDAPQNCVGLEHCPQGSKLPVKWLPSLLWSGLFYLVIFLAAATVMKWCLPTQWYWKVFRGVCGVAVTVLLWGIVSGEDTSIAVLLTTVIFTVIYGSGPSTYLRSKLGGCLALSLDALAYTFCIAIVSWFAGDWFVLAFLASLLPAILLTREVLANASCPPSIQVALLATCSAACITGILLSVSRTGLTITLYGIYGLLEAGFGLLFFIKSRAGRSEGAPASNYSTSRGTGSNTNDMRESLTSNSSRQQLEVEQPSQHSLRESAISLIPDVERQRPERPRVQGISIEFEHVDLSLENGEKILNDISLFIPAGSSTAVMGPSGCGKSSIMNVLSGRASYGKVNGDILINGGKDLTVPMLRKITGFVPQDDVMHRNLTVRENVMFQAELRLPRKAKTAEEDKPLPRGEHCTEEAVQTLELLGLGDPKLQDTKIGDEDERGVSGGQRKRVSIAMELVAWPSLLFLDEPTSGLDSTTSHSVVHMFTRAAKERHCTTLAVIHQPRYETLELFDRVILLAAGGYLVYSGPSQRAKDYFETTFKLRFKEQANPADYFLDAITPLAVEELVKEQRMAPLWEGPRPPSRAAFGQALADKWRRFGVQEFDPEDARTYGLNPNLDISTCTWGEELFVHMKRAAIQFRREFSTALSNIFLLVFGLCCLCFGNPPKGPADDLAHPLLALFLASLLQGVAAQRVFGGAERAVGWREAGSSVRMVFYFIGRDLTALVEVLLGAVTFSMLYWPFGPLLVSFQGMLWVSFALIYVVFGMNYVFSVLLPAQSAQMMAVIAAFLGWLLSGVQPSFIDLVQLAGGNGAYIVALSPLRWAHGNLMCQHAVDHVTQLANPITQLMISDKLNTMGIPLPWVSQVGWSCDNLYAGYQNTGRPPSIHTRWIGNPTTGTPPPNGLVCSSKQLLLLGIFYRVWALVCLLMVSRQKALGGGKLVDTAGSAGKREACTGYLLRAFLRLFFVAFINLQMILLLQTW